VTHQGHTEEVGSTHNKACFNVNRSEIRPNSETELASNPDCGLAALTFPPWRHTSFQKKSYSWKEDDLPAFLYRYENLYARYAGDLTLHPPYTHRECVRRWNTYARATWACI